MVGGPVHRPRTHRLFPQQQVALSVRRTREQREAAVVGVMPRNMGDCAQTVDGRATPPHNATSHVARRALCRETARPGSLIARRYVQRGFLGRPSDPDRCRLGRGYRGQGRRTHRGLRRPKRERAVEGSRNAFYAERLAFVGHQCHPVGPRHGRTHTVIDVIVAFVARPRKFCGMRFGSDLEHTDPPQAEEKRVRRHGSFACCTRAGITTCSARGRLVTALDRM